MRPTVTVERITRSVTWNGNAARSQSASTDKVSRGCARGKYLGGSDLTGVGKEHYGQSILDRSVWEVIN